MSLQKRWTVPPTLETFLNETRKVCVDYLPLALEAQLETMRKMYEIDPTKAVEELHHLKNKKHAREGMALKRKKDKERERLQETVAAAQAVVLVEQENDLTRKEQYKAWLAEGYSASDISTYESEQTLATLFQAAYFQSSGRPRPDGSDFDVSDLADLQIFVAETRAKYEHLRQMRRAGFVLERKQLLSPLWQAMAGQLADFRLAAIEQFLTDAGITNLWNPRDSPDCDPYLQPRPWQSWKFVPVEPSRSESSQFDPSRVSMTIPPEQALPKQPEPVDISVTQIELDGKKITIPTWPSSRM
jgi:hypothetical protein